MFSDSNQTVNNDDVSIDVMRESVLVTTGLKPYVNDPKSTTRPFRTEVNQSPVYKKKSWKKNGA